jgi:hypothetical protein
MFDVLVLFVGDSNMIFRFYSKQIGICYLPYYFLHGHA